MQLDFNSLAPEYATDWARLDVTRVTVAEKSAQRILAARRRFETVEAATGVPWYVIGIILLREADLSFSGHLHNGDSLRRRTVHVPAGRLPPPAEPPFTWEESAIDALRFDHVPARGGDWSPARIAWVLEGYNGFGPRQHGRKSGYLWAGSNIYSAGKYVSDGVWSSDAIDQQIGGMVVLRALVDLCAVKFGPPAPRAPNVGDTVAAHPKTTAVVKVATAGATAAAPFWKSIPPVYLWGGGALLAALVIGGAAYIWSRHGRIANVAASTGE